MFRSVLIFVLAVLMTGCVTVESTHIPSGMAVAPGEPAGVVFGSVGAARPWKFTSQSFFIAKRGSDETAQIDFIHDGLLNVPIDIENEAMSGALFSIKLPAGDYEIRQVSFFINRGQFGTTTFGAKEPLSIPFSVRPNTSTYLGEFSATAIMGKNFFGSAIPAGGYFKVSDQFSRDSALFAKKREALLGWPLLNQTLKFGDTDSPFFHSPAQ